jgi:hypothetical protein
VLQQAMEAVGYCYLVLMRVHVERHSCTSQMKRAPRDVEDCAMSCVCRYIVCRCVVCRCVHVRGHFCGQGGHWTSYLASLPLDDDYANARANKGYSPHLSLHFMCGQKTVSPLILLQPTTVPTQKLRYSTLFSCILLLDRYLFVCSR